jgi:ERCC4-type nuclease
MARKRNKFKVIRDTREHENKGWFFKESDYCTGMVEKKLDTGDYSIEGLEDILCIERKGSISEFANNITDARFDRELERMSEFKYKFLILEFSFDDIRSFPEGSGIPTRAWASLRVTGNFIMKKIAEYQTKYGVHVIPVDNKLTGWYMAHTIMKRVAEVELKDDKEN